MDNTFVEREREREEVSYHDGARKQLPCGKKWSASLWGYHPHDCDNKKKSSWKFNFTCLDREEGQYLNGHWDPRVRCNHDIFDVMFHNYVTQDLVKTTHKETDRHPNDKTDRDVMQGIPTRIIQYVHTDPRWLFSCVTNSNLSEDDTAHHLWVKRSKENAFSLPRTSFLRNLPCEDDLAIHKSWWKTNRHFQWWWFFFHS